MPMIGGPGGGTVPDVAVTEDMTNIGGVWGCGQASMTVLLYLYGQLGAPLSVATVTALCKETIAAGQVTNPPHYATSPSNLMWLANKHGLQVTNLGGGGALQAIQQGQPGVMGVSNATVFGGSDSNVNGHYVCPLHMNADGSVTVADPNQPPSRSGKPVVYSLAQLRNASPFCYIVASSAPLSPGGNGAGSSGASGGASLGGANTIASWWQSATSLFTGAGGVAGPLTAFTDPFLALMLTSSQALEGMTGLAGVCYAIENAEQLPGIDTSWDLKNPVGSVVKDVMTTTLGNGRAVMVRGAFFAFGFLLFVGLILAIVLENASEEIGEVIQLAPMAAAALA